MIIELSDISLNYELRGDGDSVVLIHGFSDNLNMWHDQVAALSPGYQVLTYDFRGHGRTRTPDTEMTMEMHANDLAMLLAALEIETACITGYSMGARIALEFALRYPQKTTGLVMANMAVAGRESPMSAKTAALTQKHLRMVIRLCETGDMAAIATELVSKSLSPDFQKIHPQVVQQYRDVKMQNDPRGFPAVIRAMLGALDTPPDLGQVAAPALLLAGEHDPFKNPDLVVAMQKEMPQADVKVLSAGHATAIEAPKAFNEVLQAFLKTLE